MAYYNSGNRIQRESPIVFNLIIINVLFYLAQIFLKQYDVTNWGALHYYQSPDFKPHQLITNMFMHDPSGIGHLFFNMFALYIFGTTLERFWGSKRFFIFYLICGIGASIIIELTIPFSAGQMAKTFARETVVPAEQMPALLDQIKMQYMALGASGAIMGLEAAFAYLFPNTSLYVMFIPVPVKAKYVIPVFLLIDLFGGLAQFKGDSVGHFAHLGGALIGFIIVLIWNKTNKKTFY